MVHQVGDLALGGGPVAGHALIRRAAKQEHVRGLQLVNRDPFQLFAPDGIVPAKVPAFRSLEETIERDHVPHDDFSHLPLPPVVSTYVAGPILSSSARSCLSSRGN